MSTRDRELSYEYQYQTAKSIRYKKARRSRCSLSIFSRSMRKAALRIEKWEQRTGAVVSVESLYGSQQYLDKQIESKYCFDGGDAAVRLNNVTSTPGILSRVKGHCGLELHFFCHFMVIIECFI